jgi:hypothetical protein
MEEYAALGRGIPSRKPALGLVRRELRLKRMAAEDRRRKAENIAREQRQPKTGATR